MVPNNITKPVKQFTIPRLLISFTIILILIPIGLLFHYFSINKELLTKNMALEENLLYIPTHWPTDPNKITSPFGPRNDPFNRSRAIHSGIDVRGKTGTPIYAAADGTVQLAQYHGGYGNTIIINHSDRYETLYAHLSKISVEQGDQVLKGDVIGELGSTGRSTGPHLHYEIIKSEKAVDPEPYLNFFDNEIN
ncbi:MAG TPA: M23 family metallopeptidase [Bacilli bacterium]|nr:M23 family metallopeptidase [Bacilli bacterium]